MYRGVARLIGIPVVSQPTTAADVCAEAAEAMKDHTFVFAHFKYTDKTGEDGDLAGKIRRIEEMDAALPKLLAARPDVLVITGDHSTPPSLKAHSWHPVPVLMQRPPFAAETENISTRSLPERTDRHDPRQGAAAPGDGPRRQTRKIRGVMSI